MKRIKLLGLFFILGLISFTSCKSVDDAQKAADSFFEAFNNQDEKAMETILDKESVIDAGIKDDFYDVFNKHASAFGTVTNHKRYAFSTNTNNGLTTVTLKFKCDTEKGHTVFEKLKFVKRGDAYKLYEFVYNKNKAAIDKED
ncbi:MAG: hypothetical protein GXO80_13520 [Chlorobi bacterium]|nr:hypothetical protein [Chlorobiota bacterium]